MTTTSRFLLGGDMPVNRIGFGAMRLSATGFTGPARDPETGRRVLRRALELGVNHIDTATIYRSHDGTVTANGLIRNALTPYPEDLVIATKVGPWEHPDGRIEQTDNPAALRPAVEANLAGLGLERLDLVYLRVGHMEPPHGQSIAAQFEVLAQMRDEGRIRHLALSNVDIDHLAEAQRIAPVAAVQNQFHTGRRDDIEILAACQAQGIGFVPFFPLGGGMNDLRTGALQRVADRHGVSAYQIALAWLLATSPVTLLIPGTGSVEHLEDNVAAGTIELSEDDLVELR